MGGRFVLAKIGNYVGLLKGPYDKRQITLDRSYKGASTREGTVMTGAVSDMAIQVQCGSRLLLR